MNTSDQGDSNSFTTRAGEVKVAVATMPTTYRDVQKNKKEKKKKNTAKHCFGYTQNFIHLSTTTKKDLYKIML